ncbi:MAG: YaiO family outer membrane beta-barrel protein [Candidatus Marinimicrobia bacterium]|nr:YaiO family outer membrane beta-barrel protein [Candidatus Neomarinimicrobiota bacterium]
MIDMRSLVYNFAFKPFKSTSAVLSDYRRAAILKQVPIGGGMFHGLRCHTGLVEVFSKHGTIKFIRLLAVIFIVIPCFAEMGEGDSTAQKVSLAESSIFRDYRLNNNSDSLYQYAREVAFVEKNNQLAIRICQRGLDLTTDHYETRIFLGRLYAWEGQYDSAAVQLHRVLDEQIYFEDARSALADVYIWSGNYVAALELLEQGLQLNPLNTEFIYKRGVCLLKLEQFKASQLAFQQVLKQDPGHAKATAILADLSRQGRARKVSIGYSYNRLAGTRTPWQVLVGRTTLEPWHQLRIELEQRLSFGPVIARFNFARRFGQSGMQFELESYPTIRKGTYAYLALGYSGTQLFPSYRTGAEVFQVLPQAFEVSAGYRSVHLEALDLNIFTGSASKYWRSYWFSIRSFLTPQEVSFSRAWNFQCRRYIRDAETYLELSFGQGESPDISLGAVEVSYLSSRHLNMTYQWKLDDLNLIKSVLSFANVEVRKAAYRGDTGFYISYSRRF